MIHCHPLRHLHPLWRVSTDFPSQMNAPFLRSWLPGAQKFGWGLLSGEDSWFHPHFQRSICSAVHHTRSCNLVNNVAMYLSTNVDAYTKGLTRVVEVICKLLWTWKENGE